MELLSPSEETNIRNDIPEDRRELEPMATAAGGNEQPGTTRDTAQQEVRVEGIAVPAQSRVGHRGTAQLWPRRQRK